MKNRRGLTLIEVIISIALLSLIAVTFLGMFNMGNTFIFKAGKDTKAVMGVKDIVDSEIKIAEGKRSGTNEIKITIPGVIENHPIKGTKIEKNDTKDPKIKIITFVPNKKETN